MLVAVEAAQRAQIEQLRRLLCNQQATPAVFRAALTAVPPAERDLWLDAVLGCNELPDDDPALPRGCVPYLPCSVNLLLQMVEQAELQASDVFVDIGAGLGRAAVAVHLLTGASAIGVEIQPQLVAASRNLAARLQLSRFAALEGDATELAGFINGTVFFLYCPFSGERLTKVLNALRALAQARPIRICCVDLPLPQQDWLTPVAPPCGSLAVYRSTPRGALNHPASTNKT
jgi:SAM-dependent methyltransferase